MRYVDTHCHLSHHEELTPQEQVRRAREAGVSLMVTVGTDLASSSQAVACANRFEDVYAAVGVHPNDAMEATPRVLDVIAELADEPRCVAVGETGLDYYRDHTTPAVQKASFREHIALAKRRDLTLVVHCRDAWDDCLDVLATEGAPDRVVMHCFSGDEEVTARCVEAGYFLSFAGNVTFTNAGELRRVAGLAPAGLLLTETDSPFLTPHPHRGAPNDPSYVPLTLAALAEVHDRDAGDLAEVVYANTLRAFAIDGGGHWAGPSS